MNLWNMLESWKRECRWVELSRAVSPETVHWAGFPTMQEKQIFDVVKDGFTVHEYQIVGQYGTHADAPSHFVAGGRTIDTFGIKDMVLPLCVVSACEQCAANPDYALSVEDILAWEKRNGRIPEGAFVAFRSDWSKKGGMKEMQNADANGQNHYPGWSVDAIRFLVEERSVASIGHESSDTDPAVIAAAQGFPGELYILQQDRFQIELMVNLDQVPETGAVIFCTFPRVTGGAGFTARCFALCPA
jgi:kynurenine formamidase